MGEWNAKRNIIQGYDSTAHIYDVRYAQEQTAKIEAAIKRMKIDKGSSILDVGCGTGLLFDYVGDEAKAIVGLDVSKRILLQAKKRAEKKRNVDLILADADNMPLKQDIFNHIFAVTLLQNMPNAHETLNEIKRVAKEKAFITVTGLKKKFSTQFFMNLLKDAGLNISILMNKDLKCHVAVCTKFLFEDSEFQN